jgi:hypothetical protein
MFDDHTTSSSGQVPSNLPLGEPEDIFSGTEQNDAPVASQPLEPPAAAPVADLQASAPALPVLEKMPSAEEPVDASVPQASALDAGVLKPKGVPQAEEEPIDDMFEQTDVAPPPAVPTAMPPVAAEVPVAVVPPPIEQAPLQQSQQVQAPAPFQPQSESDIQIPPPLPQDDMYDLKEPSLSRGIMTVIIIIVVLIILGGGGWWIYSSFIASPKDSRDIFETTTFPTDVNVPTPEQKVVETPDIQPTVVESVDDSVLFGEPIDSDGDGLDDIREAGINTDPNNWDSDGDDLSDGDEVVIWKTNPLNPDTDGDTYLDGAEVKAGYSPSGPGRIFEPPIEEESSVATSSPVVVTSSPIVVPETL